MFEDILDTYDYKIERYENGMWIKTKFADLKKNNIFRYLEAPHRQFQAREVPKFDQLQGKWVVLGAEITGTPACKG